MANLRTKKILAPQKHFLAFPDHYVNVTGKIAFNVLDTLAKAGDDGVKRVLAGTLVHMDEAGAITKCDGTTAKIKANAVIFDEIVADDYDSTDTQVNASVLVHGFIRKDRVTELTTGDLASLDNPMIYVIEK